MKAFDPFTSTLDEALAQPDAHVTPRGAVLRWGSAQQINETKDYYTRHPVDGVAACVRYGLIAPDWLAEAFIRQYDKVLNCRVATWDDAFGPAHPTGKHLSTYRLIRQYGWRLQELFKDSEFHGRARLPRTLRGREEAARFLGISEKQARALLPKTRTNIKGHKPYGWKSATVGSANDPFSLAASKVPKK